MKLNVWKNFLGEKWTSLNIAPLKWSVILSNRFSVGPEKADKITAENRAIPYHRETREQRRSLVFEITVANVDYLSVGRRFPVAGRVRAAAVLVQRPALGKLKQVRFQVAVRRQQIVARLVVQCTQKTGGFTKKPSCMGTPIKNVKNVCLPCIRQGLEEKNM